MFKMDEKMKQMEDEMSRFEAELGSQIMTPAIRPVIGANTYNQVAKQLEQHDFPPTPVVASGAAPYSPYSQIIGFPPPPPPPVTPAMVPHQVSRKGPPPVTTYSSPAQMSTSFKPNMVSPSASTMSKTPMVYPEINRKAPEDESKRKLPAKNVSTAAQLAISQGKASSIMATASIEENHPRSKGKKNKKIIRMAGGQTWEDGSLLDWDEDDFRIFCGDLGNDVTDEMLVRVFAKYSSFLRAKVIRDKKTNKTKGFGFVSFKNPQDFINAMKEMNGKYVGSRPIKLRKSSWKQRNLETVRRKEKEKQNLIKMLL